MSLSIKAQKTLVVALASKTASTELQAIVAARSGTASPDLQRRLVDGLGRVAGKEVIASLTSGAALSDKSCKRALVMMAGDATAAGGMEAMGNELINLIQTTPRTRKIVL